MLFLLEWLGWILRSLLEMVESAVSLLTPQASFATQSQSLPSMLHKKYDSGSNLAALTTALPPHHQYLHSRMPHNTSTASHVHHHYHYQQQQQQQQGVTHPPPLLTHANGWLQHRKKHDDSPQDHSLHNTVLPIPPNHAQHAHAPHNINNHIAATHIHGQSTKATLPSPAPILQRQHSANDLDANAHLQSLPQQHHNQHANQQQAISPLSSVAIATQSEANHRNADLHAESPSLLSTIPESHKTSNEDDIATFARGIRGSQPIVQLNRLRLLANASSPSSSTSIRSQSLQGSTLHHHVDNQHLMTKTNNNEKLNNAAIQGNTIQTMHGRSQETTNATTSYIDGHDVSPLASLLPVIKFHELIGANDVTNRLGSGAFGLVFRATWRGTPVAVKTLSAMESHIHVIPRNNNDNTTATSAATMLALEDTERGAPDLPATVLSAFEDEASMLARLRHPNICLLLGVCLEPFHKAMVTELVCRGSLWDALRCRQHFQVYIIYVAVVINIITISVFFNGIILTLFLCCCLQREQHDPFFWPLSVIRKVLEGAGRGLAYLHNHQPAIIHRG